MCGRYGIVDPQFIGEHFQLYLELPDLVPRYNAAPSQRLPVIVQQDGNRRLDMMRWGLVPGWAKDTAKSLINARAEAIDTKPSFRAAFRRGRCLVPASHFFEWATTPAGKVPHCIRVTDAPLFAFAGLYDVHRDADGRAVAGFAIVTTEQNELMAGIHTRMPVILSREAESTWLGDTATEELLALLRPYPAEAMQAFPVGSLVNRPANDTAQVLLPV